MTISIRHAFRHLLRRATGPRRGALFGLPIALAGLGAAPGALAAVLENYCSQTAATQAQACRNETAASYFTAQAACTNVVNADRRSRCQDEAQAARAESQQLCADQLDARRGVCADVGEARYDARFNPGDFETDFHNLANPNPYFPLAVGNHWSYGGAEVVNVDVLDQTKLIDGVTCVVVHDRVEVDGVLEEDTFDWFAQRRNRSVNYCGEISATFEVFPGDRPRKPELVAIGGSWKAGRFNAQSGVQFPGTSPVGEVYRQEYLPDTAEDIAQTLSTTYRYGEDARLDRFVPPALATLMCAPGDCIVTLEHTPMEPGEFERKYYAAGIGNFLVIELGTRTGNPVVLTGCNFDSRCASLPPPP